jgi:integrase
LARWYLGLEEVMAKRSYDRDKRSLMKLQSFLGKRLLKDLTPALVEAYRQKRLNESSYRGHLTKPATINRELACLKTLFNKAIRNGKAERNPVRGVIPLKENNIRNRVLSEDEYRLLLEHSADYLKPILKVAYHTGMRRGEILKLSWDKVDLKRGFIRLEPEDTKTNEGRIVPLHDELIKMFKAMPSGLPGIKVFTRNGNPISCVREAFESACRRAAIEGFTFHDLRHTYVTNKCREGHPYFVIMASTGHKTMSTFKRYNTVSEDDLKTLVGKMTRKDGHQYGHQADLSAEEGAVL